MTTDAEPTLFGHALQDELRASLATIKAEKRVIVDRYITLDGKRFDLDDLIETLRLVEDDDIIVDQWLGDVLVKLKVLSSRGSRNWCMGARAGENFELFRSLLQEATKCPPSTSTSTTSPR